MHRTLPIPSRGMALIWVVAILTVLLLMVGVIAKSLVSAHGERRVVARRLQAAFLAESGLERAAARLARQHDYRGEVWNLPADHGLDAPATITIAIADNAARPHERAVTITASYGHNEAHRALASKQVTLAVPVPSSTSPQDD